MPPFTEAYDIGDLRRLTVALTDIGGAAADPTELTLTIRTPDGVSTVYSLSESPSTIQKSSTGNYYIDYPMAQAGRHSGHWKATGALVAADMFDFYVRRSQA